MRKQVKWILLHGETLALGHGKGGGCALNSFNFISGRACPPQALQHPGGVTVLWCSWPCISQMPGECSQHHQPRYWDRGRQEAERDERGNGTPGQRERVLGLVLTWPLTLALKRSIFSRLHPLPRTPVSSLGWKLTSNMCPQHFRWALLSTTSMLTDNCLLRALNWREKDMEEVLPVPPSDYFSPVSVHHNIDPRNHPNQTGLFMRRFFESNWRKNKKILPFFSLLIQYLF